MLLNEIKYILPEVLNTKQNLSWIQKNNKLLSSFNLDDREYTIIIEYFNISELQIDNIRNVYEVSFTGKDKNSKESFKATGNNIKNGHNLKVFSIVKNAVQEKIKTLNFDLIFFDAKNIDDYYKSRVSLYQTLTAMLRKKLDLFSFEKQYDNFHIFILSKENIEPEIIDSIIKLI